MRKPDEFDEQIEMFRVESEFHQVEACKVVASKESQAVKNRRLGELQLRNAHLAREYLRFLEHYGATGGASFK